MESLILVRPPHAYRYNMLDIQEETIFSYWLGYLHSINEPIPVLYDFHLDPTNTIERLITWNGDGNKTYIISCREHGDTMYYALRIGSALLKLTSERVIFYGQTGRLETHPWFVQLKKAFGSRLEKVLHDEVGLARALGLRDDGPSFGAGLKHRSYLSQLCLDPPRRKRLKASIETTRGCHFPCKFCFINTGQNYPARWVRRPKEDILADIASAYNQGYRRMVFRDSEFLGIEREDYREVENMLVEVEKQFPSLQFKIYARADTLLSFGNFELLKRAGLASVYIGVESLVDEDLVALNKRTKVQDLLGAIHALQESGIYMDLSFILFNRHTTFATLEANIDQLYLLYRKDARYLGMPFFSFSFENSWRPEPGRLLSPRTYVALDLAIKAPNAVGAVFDPVLEPLMECYRLLTYEWSAKVTALNLARDVATPEEHSCIETWFQALPLFCLRVMRRFLNEAKMGRLTLDSLNAYRDQLYDLVGAFYCAVLPTQLATCLTYEKHGRLLDYTHPIYLLEPEEYWEDAIPPVDRAQWEKHTQPMQENA